MAEASAGKEPFSFEGNNDFPAYVIPKVFKAVIHPNFHTKSK